MILLNATGVFFLSKRKTRHFMVGRGVALTFEKPFN
jgi:hypothetical protein